MVTTEIYPKPLPRGDVTAATDKLANRFLKEWESVTNQIKNTARAGDNYSNQVEGLPGVANQIVDALGGAKPGSEKGQLVTALGNGAGVGAELGRAVGKANDPNTDPGQVDFAAANRAAGFAADGITRDANGLRGYPEPDDGGGGGPPQI